MLNIGLHNAYKQKDVASASEVSESSSGCSAEVGEAVTGTGHAVRALESSVLSRLFVKSQPHPWAIFSDAYLLYPMHVLGTNQWVTSVKPCVPEGHSSGQAHPSCAGPGGVSLPAAPGLGFCTKESHSIPATPTASQLLALGCELVLTPGVAKAWDYVVSQQRALGSPVEQWDLRRSCCRAVRSLRR